MAASFGDHDERHDEGTPEMGEVNNIFRGPGWWLAADGKWYPPEQHPGNVRPDVAPASPQEDATDSPTSPPLNNEQPDELAAYQGLKPGWYRDPSNPELARYWDGRTLSELTRPAVGPSAPPRGPTFIATSPWHGLRNVIGIDKPSRRRALGITFGVLAACLVLAIVVDGIAGQKGPAPSPTLAASGNSDAPSSSPPPSTAPPTGAASGTTTPATSSPSSDPSTTTSPSTAPQTQVSVLGPTAGTTTTTSNKSTSGIMTPPTSGTPTPATTITTTPTTTTTTTTAPPRPSLTLIPSADPATTGPVAYSVSVAGSGPTPTGSVIVSDGQGSFCVIPALSSGAGFCFITEDAANSPYVITTTYLGDDNYSSSAATLVETVDPAVPVVLITPSANPAMAGEVDYTVAVAGSGPDATGSVVISDGQNGTCSVLTLTSDTGECFIVEGASVDPYTVTAVYSGDNNYVEAATEIVETVS